MYIPYERFAFVPSSVEGKIEYIFAYRDSIPTQDEEPELYIGASVTTFEKTQRVLDFGHEEIVVLLTIEDDDRYKKEHPDIVDQHELFKIDNK
jgi:hypothetical protein